MIRDTKGDYGMAAAADRHSMYDGEWKNDSRKVKLTVSIGRYPPRLQVLENFSGGTKWTTTGAGEKNLSETLLQIKHGLPFKPEFLCFFATTTVPGGFGGVLGAYEQNHATMLTNAFNYGEEGLDASADETYFYIKHTVYAFPGDRTFYGSDFKFRVRFEILNIRDLNVI